MNKSTIIITTLFILIYIIPLGIRPMIIPDEFRYAEIPREMIASGDWIVPHLDGFRYFEKPVLGYWLNGISMLAFGENTFAMRLPSAIAAGLSALLIFFIVRKFFNPPSVGILATTVFLTCLLVFAVGTFNVLDTMLSLFITGAMFTFFFAHMENRIGKKRVFLVLFGFSCGLAFLIKGFLAFAVPVVTIVPFMIWERRLREIFKICWIPLMTALLVALPWAVMIHYRESDFWHFFFWNEHIRRFTADNAQHHEPVFFYLYGLIAAAMPWTFFSPAAISGLRLENSENKLVRFALCWFLFPLLFFSLSKGKLITYILPCFPPLAILMAIGIHRYFREGRSKAFNVGALSLACMFLIMTAALIVIQLIGPSTLKFYSKSWQIFFIVTVLLSFTLFMFLASGESRWNRKVFLVTAAMMVFMFLYPFILPDSIVEKKTPKYFLLRNADRIHNNTIFISDEILFSAICWTYKRSDVYVVGGKGELEYGFGYEDSQHRSLGLPEIRGMIQDNRGSGIVTMILRTRKYKQLEGSLDEPVFLDTTGEKGYVFAQY